MGSRRVRRRSAAAIAFLLGLFWIVCVDVNNDPESATEGVEEHSVSSRGLMRFCDLHQRHMERFDPEDYRALWETSLLPADDVEVRFQKASAKSRPSGKRVAIVHVRGDHFHAWLLRVWPRVKSALATTTLMTSLLIGPEVRPVRGVGCSPAPLAPHTGVARPPTHGCSYR